MEAPILLYCQDSKYVVYYYRFNMSLILYTFALIRWKYVSLSPSFAAKPTEISSPVHSTPAYSRGQGAEAASRMKLFSPEPIGKEGGAW